MAQVSGIEVSIGGNPAGLERALGKAEGAISRFSKTAIAGLAGALSAGAFVAAGKAALNYADKISKVSQKIGMTTEELSGLNYAAKLSGVEMGQLQSSMGIMARKMGDSEDSFKAFGVTLRNTDGSMRGTNQVLMDVAERFSKMPDGVQKSQWALELFGRSGLDLIPLLNGGAAGISAMTEEARMFGVVVSQDAARGAEQFNDNITRMQQYVAGAVQNFTTGMTPALVNVSEALVNSAKSTEAFKTAGEVAGRILEGVARVVIVVKDNLGLLGDVIKGIGLVIFTRYLFGAAAGFVAFAKAVKAATITMTAFNLAKKVGLVGFITLAAGIAIATDSVDELQKGLQFVYQTAQDMIPGMAELGAQIANAVGIDLSGLEADLSAARKLVEESNAAMGIPAIPGGKGDSKEKGATSVVPGVAPSQEVDAFFMSRLESIRNGFMSERELLEAQYIEDMTLLQAHLTGKDELDAEFKELMRKRAEQHAKDLNAIEQARVQNDLSMISQGLGSMASAFASGGKKMLRISKVFAAAQAIVDTIKAAVHAMTNPALVDPASKFAAYAAVFAKGMSAVAAIRGVSESGGGGRAGGGGGASTPATAAASTGGGGSSGGPTTTFSFTLMNDPMGFGESFARQFIDQLNATQRNGGTIRGVIA
jgi:uncharacterized membrane protein YgcG